MPAVPPSALPRVLLVHNAYQQRGGEDSVVQAEAELLRSRGHEVAEYRRHNDEIAGLPAWRAAGQALWSRRTQREAGALMRSFRPDVVHVHNTFPLISPSLYWAAGHAGVAVVQTLHNFRLLCPQGLLLREGRICEDCVGRAPLPAVRHACYQGRRPQTAVTAGMLVLHRALGTWQHKVHRYIALNEFCRSKFIEGGLPAARVVVKPNFVDLPDPGITRPRTGLLFVGRLSAEKGVATLAAAAPRLQRAGQPAGVLRVAGSGPQAALLQGLPALAPLGALPAAEVAQEMGRAIALVLPSICYEQFPRTLVEAMACGLPVIASRLGALAELIEDGVTGLLVDTHDTAQWAERLCWALDHPQQMAAMGRAARQAYERQYTGDINHAQLLAIYRDAMAEAAGQRAAGSGATP